MIAESIGRNSRSKNVDRMVASAYIAKASVPRHRLGKNCHNYKANTYFISSCS
jgi:hypothetical protein